jgi:hypothetical protein
MSCETLERKCDLPQLELECLLLKAGVSVRYWPEWFDLTWYGIPPSKAARHCKGSAQALPAILKAISDRYFKAMGIKFPPKDWQPSKRQLASVTAVA